MDEAHTLDDAEFCALKGTLASAYAQMSSEQLLEVADDLHEIIRFRHDDPQSGASVCEKLIKLRPSLHLPVRAP